MHRTGVYSCLTRVLLLVPANSAKAKSILLLLLLLLPLEGSYSALLIADSSDRRQKEREREEREREEREREGGRERVFSPNPHVSWTDLGGGREGEGIKKSTCGPREAFSGFTCTPTCFV